MAEQASSNKDDDGWGGMADLDAANDGFYDENSESQPLVPPGTAQGSPSVVASAGAGAQSAASAAASAAASGCFSAVMSCASIKNSRHPYVAFFHIFFKVSALLVYMFCTMLTDRFILSFVLCILLLAMDFWTVKNVSGRLLVGLRWWNEIMEDGKNSWKFEKVSDPSKLIPSDSTIFWGGLMLSTVMWCLLLVSAVIGLKLAWLMIVAVGAGAAAGGGGALSMLGGLLGSVTSVAAAGAVAAARSVGGGRQSGMAPANWREPAAGTNIATAV